ncbi:hypothetical protein [Sulfuriroseicoccus oceanibius]|uniref:Uncharacterized protein n=1 Tax=Sulfuriroseicoccus oceanibius TaxID=2707525 RepID=A0A6B3L3B5_9BACT|nr:hypothetical protein [Sulfuriroseicoccus oceanibius]QQL44124.1 hypothetical protein G3M56_009475 [Sulfuriroseicoccus oceanibius]
MSAISEFALWCRRGDQVIPFVASVGMPRQNGELWECEWSMGALLPREGHHAVNINSMLAMTTALNSVAVFLKARTDAGDRFYIDEELTQEIDDVAALFWGAGRSPSQRQRSD